MPQHLTFTCKAALLIVGVRVQDIAAYASLLPAQFFDGFGLATVVRRVHAWELTNKHYKRFKVLLEWRGPSACRACNSNECARVKRSRF